MGLYGAQGVWGFSYQPTAVHKEAAAATSFATPMHCVCKMAFPYLWDGCQCLEPKAGYKQSTRHGTKWHDCMPSFTRLLSQRCDRVEPARRWLPCAENVESVVCGSVAHTPCAVYLVVHIPTSRPILLNPPQPRSTRIAHSSTH